MRNLQLLRYRKSLGFSFVEVMAGLLLGLIATVVIYQVLAVSEGYKRKSMGGGDAQQNGSIALYLLERDLKQAGSGINVARYGDLIAADNGGRNFNFFLAPVVITPGAGNAPDTVDIVYGNANVNGDFKQLSANMAASNATMTLFNPFGVQNGDVFVIAEAGNTGALGQVTNVAGNVVSHAAVAVGGNSFNQNPFPIPYTTAAILMNFGQITPLSEPAVNRYTVANNQLQLTRRLVTNTPVSVADNVFTIKAQYGIAAAGTTVVSSYVDADPTNAAGFGLPAGVQLSQVVSIRIAIVSRVNVYEKQAVTTAIKLWPDSASTPTTTGPTINMVGDDQRYRYRVFTTIVPLRNVVWPTITIP